jgi:hypothetical protein
MKLRSLLDLDLPPLGDAEHVLADLASQRSSRLVGAVVLAGLAATAAWQLPDVGFALAAGAAAALIASAIAVGRRRTLLSSLVQVRAAYRIEPVSQAGARFASRARRLRLAGWLRKMVRAAEGDDCQAGYTAPAIEERVLARKQRLLQVAAALEGHEDDLHPAGVAIVHRLLTRPSLSPLYNPHLDEQILDDALRRVEVCTRDAA